MDYGKPAQTFYGPSYDVQPMIVTSRQEVQFAETGGHRHDEPLSKDNAGRDQALDLQKPLPPEKEVTLSGPPAVSYRENERLPTMKPMQKTLRKKDSGHSRNNRLESTNQQGGFSSSVRRFLGNSGVSYTVDDRERRRGNGSHQTQHEVRMDDNDNRLHEENIRQRTQYEVRMNDNETPLLDENMRQRAQNELPMTDDEMRLRDENVRQKQTIDQLQADLRKAHATADSVKHSVDRMQLAMDNKQLFVGTQLSDDVLQWKFQSLLSRVKTWAGKFRPARVPFMDTLDESIKAEFEAVAPGCTRASQRGLWEEGKTFRLLVRGWIGLLLAERFFRHRSGAPGSHSDAMDQWMGQSLQRSVSGIEDKLAYTDRTKISYRDLHDWRALTVELLSKVDLGKTAAEDMRSFVKDNTPRVMGLASSFETESSYKDSAESLHQIFENAIQVSHLLRRQRACWSVSFRRRVLDDGAAAIPPTAKIGFTFNPSHMKDDREEDDEELQAASRGKRVTLVITPALFKCGNADGEGYEVKSCMVPLLVLCEKL